VDQNESRLRQAILDIEGLRQEGSAEKTAAGWGDILVFDANQLSESLANSWLAVEVQAQSNSICSRELIRTDEFAVRPRIAVAEKGISQAAGRYLKSRNDSRI
jgi:hypothetical protein